MAALNAAFLHIFFDLGYEIGSLAIHSSSLSYFDILKPYSFQVFILGQGCVVDIYVEIIKDQVICALFSRWNTSQVGDQVTKLVQKHTILMTHRQLELGMGMNADFSGNVANVHEITPLQTLPLLHGGGLVDVCSLKVGANDVECNLF